MTGRTRVEAFRSLALPWMEAERRDLPWRRSRDPWEVHVAECMLQQTQVARVVPRWHGFLGRFPTAADCAMSPVSETIRLWEGLGYNRRAVQLHACASSVTNDHGGSFPDTIAELVRLPGVGPYTARAILAFAYEKEAAVLDTNVARIVSRCLAGRPLRLADAQMTADSLVPPEAVWAWNQGMLDLGALICTKRSPNCGGCPVMALCAWRNGEADAPDPAVGSAGVGVRQTTFEGSDRQLRGRLVDALRRGPVGSAGLLIAAGCSDADRVGKVISSLVRDGLAARTPEGFVLGS